MRHTKQGRKLSREAGERRALLRTMAVSLVKHGAIKTTEAKAKSLRPFVERLVTHARTGTLAKRRLVLKELGLQATKKIFEIYGPKYVGRAGGYTRIVKLPPRIRDASPLAKISFV